MNDLKFTRVRDAVQNPACNIKSVADALRILPEEFRKEYVVFYKSRSVQGPERIILTGGRPGFKLSITADPKAKGGNRMEMMDIDTSGPPTDLNIFKLNEIEFPFDEKTAAKKSWADVQAGIRSSKHPNESQCTKCHGNPPRPIYPGYPIWEGSFGSHFKGQGTLTKSTFLGPPGELEAIRNFSRRVSTGKNERLNLLGKYMIDGPEGGSFEPPVSRFMTVSEDLNGELGDANGIRVARLILQTPDYDKYKYAIMSGLLGCKDFSSSLPGAIREGLINEMNRRFELPQQWTSPKIEDQMRKIYNHPDHFQLVDYVSRNTEPKTRPPYDQFKTHFTKDFGQPPSLMPLYLDTFKVQGLIIGPARFQGRSDFKNIQLIKPREPGRSLRQAETVQSSLSRRVEAGS